MPLSVIGAGLGRTGTLSLKLALERLGSRAGQGGRRALIRLLGPTSAGEAGSGYHVFASHH